MKNTGHSIAAEKKEQGRKGRLAAHSFTKQKANGINKKKGHYRQKRKPTEGEVAGRCGEAGAGCYLTIKGGWFR